MVLMLPIDIQPQAPGELEPQPAAAAGLRHPRPVRRSRSRRSPTCSQEAAAAADHRRARRRAGRRPRRARSGSGALIGALLATSAPANGLFAGPALRARASPAASPPRSPRELMPQADVVLVAGASVNHWTTRHGQLDRRPAPRWPRSTSSRARSAATGPPTSRARRRCRRRAAARRRTRAPRPPAPPGGAPTQMAADIAANGWRDDPYEDASHRRVDRPADAVDRAGGAAARR